MFLLFTSLTSSAFGSRELICVRKKNWWKDMGFLDRTPPSIYKNKQILAFQGTQGTQHPETFFLLTASCLLKRNPTQTSFVKPLFSAKLVFFSRSSEIFLCLKICTFLISTLLCSSKCLIKSLLPMPPEFVNNFLFTNCFGWDHIFYSLLQFSEMQYIKRNLTPPNKFNLLCHSCEPSTLDQSVFSLVFPNLSLHSLKNNENKTK